MAQGHQEILVDFEELERVELKNLRKHAMGGGILSLVMVLLAWSPYITPIIAGLFAMPTCWVAYSRLKSVHTLLQGENCWCKCCGPNPRNTLKQVRTFIIIVTVLCVIAVITQIAFLAEFGRSNDIGGAVGVVGIICLLLIIANCFVMGIYAHNHVKAVTIFDSVTARQHLKQQELGLTSLPQAVVGVVTGAINSATAPPPQQHQQYQQQPQQQQQYGQHQQPPPAKEQPPMPPQQNNQNNQYNV